MRRYLVIATAILSLSAGPAFALGFDSGTSGNIDPGRTVMTPRGPIVTTGHVGQMETTTLPGSARQGLLMNNGNGVSTLIVPGGVPEMVPTPR